MQAKLSDFNTRLLSGRSLDEQMDNTLGMVQALGFEALVYDYSPVPLDHDGALITPTVLKLRNTPVIGTRSGVKKVITRSTLSSIWQSMPFLLLSGPIDRRPTQCCSRSSARVMHQS